MEALVFRIQLTDEALFVTDLRGRRCYPATDIAGVEEAKGMPTTLLLSDGRSSTLPKRKIDGVLAADALIVRE